MSHTHVHVARQFVASECARLARRTPPTNWHHVALAAIFLMLFAAELAVVIAVAPIMDPLAVVAVP